MTYKCIAIFIVVNNFSNLIITAKVTPTSLPVTAMRFKGLTFKEFLQIALADTVIIIAINFFSPVDWTTAVAIYLSTILFSSFDTKK